MPELETLGISSFGGKNAADCIDEVEVNMISDISALSKLSGTKIKRLDLGPNKISDISPLASLKNLEELNIEQNNIKDISPISKLKKLKSLYISNTGCFNKQHGVTGNKIKDLSPLTKLTNLERLVLNDCGISNIKPLGKLKNLRVLYLTGNKKLKKSDVDNLKKKLPNCTISSDYD